MNAVTIAGLIFASSVTSHSTSSQTHERPLDNNPQIGTPTPTPTPSSSPTDSDFTTWLRQVRERIKARRHYPVEARAQGLEGVVLVRLRLAQSGELLKADIYQSSGHALLDAAALRNIHEAAPYPAPPPQVDVRAAIVAPVAYRFHSD